jgi:hypothetical protein
MQQRESEFVELRARADRPTRSTWISGLEGGSWGFSERHKNILARFGSFKNDSCGAPDVISELYFAGPEDAY